MLAIAAALLAIFVFVNWAGTGVLVYFPLQIADILGMAFWYTVIVVTLTIGAWLFGD